MIEIGTSFRSLTLVCLAACFGALTGPPTAYAQGSLTEDSPAGLVIEAEGHAASDSKVCDDPKAFGGKAVSNARAWQPLAAMDLPSTAIEKDLTLWVRHKGGPFQLKCTVDGKQVERDWVWAKPSQWTWSRVGRYTRKEFGQSLLLMKGDGADEVSIDRIVLSEDSDAHPKGVSSDGKIDLPTEEADPSVPASRATVTINWSEKVGNIGPMMWGVNDYEVCDPGTAADAKYNDALSLVHPGLIRVHWAGLPDAWTDAKTQSWDAEKIKAGFRGLSRGYGDAKIMLNIPWWPSWLAHPDNGVLPEEKEAAFIELVGKLVDVMRTEVKQPIAYWELLNERDDTYAKAGQLDRLWELHNKLYAEIKKHDPNAKVGGSAFTWAKPEWVVSYLKTCGSNVDFITWHNYASGDPFTPNDTLFSTVDALEANARFVKEAVQREVPGKQLELFLTEYNVQWNWQPFERRHANSVGAVFDACVLRRMALLGLDGATIWHAKGNAYGIIDANNALRAPGMLYTLGTKYVTGAVMRSNVDDSAALEIIAVVQSDKRRSLLLMNKTDHDVVVSPASKLLSPADEISIVKIDHTHADSSLREVPSGDLTLSGYSVTLLTTQSTNRHRN